jgi:membrane-associated phospholipid phosphatase
MRSAVTLALLLVLAATSATAAGVLPSVVSQLERDAAALVTVDDPPATRTLALGLASFGVLAVNDTHLARAGQDHLPSWVGRFEPGGRVAATNAVAASLVAEGLLLRDRRGTIGGLTLAEGNIILGVMLSLSKSAFGRVRPNRPEAGDWRKGGDSFPSSHAAHAFLVASVLDATLDRPAWRWAIYSLASGVALARVQEGVHFPTDVAAGGLLGWWIGHRLSIAHDLVERPGKPHLSWVPLKGGGCLVASFSW